jgi:hypothetical protein
VTDGGTAAALVELFTRKQVGWSLYGDSVITPTTILVWMPLISFMIIVRLGRAKEDHNRLCVLQVVS